MRLCHTLIVRTHVPPTGPRLTCCVDLCLVHKQIHTAVGPARERQILRTLTAFDC